jgi:hypothetical protein
MATLRTWKEAFFNDKDIRFVVHTNVARIKLPSLTKQVQNNIYSFYKIPQALSKS